MLDYNTKINKKCLFMLNPDPDFKNLKLQGHHFICNKKPSNENDRDKLISKMIKVNVLIVMNSPFWNDFYSKV